VSFNIHWASFNILTKACTKCTKKGYQTRTQKDPTQILKATSTYMKSQCVIMYESCHVWRSHVTQACVKSRMNASCNVWNDSCHVWTRYVTHEYSYVTNEEKKCRVKHTTENVHEKTSTGRSAAFLWYYCLKKKKNCARASGRQRLEASCIVVTNTYM